MKKQLAPFPIFFWICLALVLLLALISYSYIEQLKALITETNNWIFSAFGWFYLWFAGACLVLFIGIGLSPLGNIRLGGPDAKPEFSWFSWCTMLFSTGMGTGLMFWGAAEPLYHFIQFPTAGDGVIMERAVTAMHLSFFHWGFHPWAIYGLTAMAVAFFGFNLRKGFNIAHILTDATPGGHSSVLSHLIQQIIFIAIVCGVAASFGMGVLQLEAGLNYVFGVESFPGIKILIVGVFTVSFLLSALSGLSKGIKLISNIGIIGSILLMLGILVSGPKMGIMPALTTSIPAYMELIPALSLGLSSHASSDWLRDWTVKYWSWWIAWAPFVGIFVAIISKGRTIRQLMYASMLVPSLYSFLWFTIFGESAIALQLLQHPEATSLPFEKTSMILFNLLSNIQQMPILSWLALFLIAIFFINSADSATYTLASLSNPRNQDNRKPALRLQLGWGLLISGLTLLLLYAGGIKLLQQVTLLPVLPFSLWLGWLFIKTFRKLLKQARQQQA